MSPSMDPLTLPATLESLEPLVQYVLSAAAAAGLDRKASYRLRLAVDEIATNIITHGYAESHIDGDVLVHANVGDERLVITLEDWAPRSTRGSRNIQTISINQATSGQSAALEFFWRSRMWT